MARFTTEAGIDDLTGKFSLLVCGDSNAPTVAFLRTKQKRGQECRA